MAAYNYPIAVKQGTYWQRIFTVNVDLTGYTAKLKVRANAYITAPAVLSLTHSSGIAIDGSAKTVTVTITNAQSTAITAGLYSYDLVLFDTMGNGIDLLEGTFTVAFEYSQ